MFAAGVIDGGDPGGIGQGADDEAVVGDRRSDHGQHPAVDQLGVGRLDVVGRAPGQAPGLAGHQLEGPVDPPRRRHLGQAQADGLFHRGPPSAWGKS